MAASLGEQILEVLGSGGALDDDEIAIRLGVARQQVNQTCRRLAAQGVVVREPGWRGKIVNRASGQAPSAPAPPPQALASGPLTEDAVKEAVRVHLEAGGHEVTVAWGRAHGVDVEAIGPEGRVVIEAKGDAPSQQQQTNYFIGALGELVQRMSDPNATYGLALPDVRVSRALVGRLPEEVWARLGLRVYCVARTPVGLEVTELNEPPRR